MKYLSFKKEDTQTTGASLVQWQGSSPALIVESDTSSSAYYNKAPKLRTANVEPINDKLYSLGSPHHRFDSVYGVELHGTEVLADHVHSLKAEANEIAADRVIVNGQEVATKDMVKEPLGFLDVLVCFLVTQIAVEFVRAAMRQLRAERYVREQESKKGPEGGAYRSED